MNWLIKFYLRNDTQKWIVPGLCLLIMIALVVLRR